MMILDIDPINISIANEEKIINGKLQVEFGDVVLLTGPNGCGKSTIIKVLMGDIFNYNGLVYKGSKAVFNKDGKEYNVLGQQSDMEVFRRNVCYVSQDDEFETNSLMDCFMSSIEKYDIRNKEEYIYEFLLRNAAYEAFYIEGEKIHLNTIARKIARRIGINPSEIGEKEKKTLALMSININKMSGGQRKLSNILTNIIRYEFCSLVILDEPLNNLDYKNVRAFSNILTRIYKDKPNLGMIIVTHCRSIPLINKVMEIDPVNKCMKEGESYSCNSCFGKTDLDGFYI